MAFPLSTPLACALFLTIWFTVLFAVLPFGIRSQDEAGVTVPGTDPGAPIAPRLLVKALWTTVLAILVFATFIAYLLFIR